MHTTDLSTSVLASLRKPRPYPAVSVVLPTHRKATGTEQDTVRLHQLIADAVRRVQADPHVSRPHRFDVVQQLALVEQEADLRYALDSLVVFAAPGEHQLWHLSRPAAEQVTVGETFLTRNLVAAYAQARPYWVLTVAADRSRLWSGSDNELREERRTGFPMLAEGVQTDVERMERTGDVPRGYDDEETLTFLRKVDMALGGVQAAEPRPLYVVGLAGGLSALERVGVNARSAEGRLVKGGLTDGPAPRLGPELRPTREEAASRRTERALERLGRSRGTRTLAAGLDEVWHTVREGRVGMLAVEEPYRERVRVADGHLAPVAGEAGAGVAGNGVREDIVEELVEAALATDAEVVFVPDGTLAGYGRIAAELRY